MTIPRIGPPTNIPLGGSQAPQLNLPGGRDFRMAAAGLQMAGQVVGAANQIGQGQADEAVRMYRDELANRKLDANGMPVVSAKELEDSIALRVGRLGRAKFREGVQGYRLSAEEKDKSLGSFQTEANLQAYAAQRGSQAQEWSRTIDGTDPAAIEAFMDKADEEDEAFIQAQRPEDRPALKVRLADMRGRVLSGAEGTFYKARDGFQSQEIDKVADLSMSAVEGDMSLLAPKKAEVFALIDKSSLPATVKAERKEAYDKRLTFAAARGLGMRDPAALLRALGGPQSKSGDYDLSGAKGDEADSAAFWRSEGFNGAAVAGILGTFSHEGGPKGSRGVNPGDGKDGSDSIGKGQWNASRAAELRKFAAARGKPWTDNRVQDEFALMEMKRDHPDVYRKLKAAKTPAEAVAAMNDYEKPRGWKPGGKPEDVDGWSNRVKQAERIAGKVLTEKEDGKADIDPTFASLDYDDRIKLQDGAERKQAQDDAEDEKNEAEAERATFDSLMRKIQDGEAGQADIDAAKKSGQIKDWRYIDQAETAVAQRDKATNDAGAFALAMNTGQQLNPFDDASQKGADAYYKSLGAKAGPAAAFSIWERTGILPKAGAATLRGGIISTDPQSVAATASIAAQMMIRNPNAFASVEGREDIERAAIAYRHYTEGLGYSAQQAAERVAKENNPEYRSKLAPTAELDAFEKKLKKADQGGDIIGALYPGKLFPGNVTLGGPEQRAEVVATYRELALDGFKKYGNEDQAFAYAKQKIQQMYAPSQGPNGRTVVKYGLERTYQPVKGNWNYAYEQGAGIITAKTGKKTAREDVFFVPVPGVTSEEWRTGGKPPYQVLWWDRSGDEPVLRKLDKWFVPDMKPAEDLRKGDEKAFREQRSRIKPNGDVEFYMPGGA